jgi:predicted glutamine amidotransferase
MCEVLAVVWPSPRPFSAVLGWAERIEYYGIANFGWGVAWLDADCVRRYRFEGRLAADSNVAKELAGVASTHYLVHFRRPNRLTTIQLADTQPFLAADGHFAFCHNGSFIRDHEYRDRFAGLLEGKADSEVGFRVFEEMLAQGLRPDEALVKTHAQLSGIANLGYLGSDGELVVFNSYPNNPFHRFRSDGAEIAATGLHSADDSLFQLVFPAATDRRVVAGAEAMTRSRAPR